MSCGWCSSSTVRCWTCSCGISTAGVPLAGDAESVGLPVSPVLWSLARLRAAPQFVPNPALAESPGSLQQPAPTQSVAQGCPRSLAPYCTCGTSAVLWHLSLRLSWVVGTWCRITTVTSVRSVCWTCGSSTVCCTSESQALVVCYNGHVRRLRLWYLESLPDLLDERNCLCIMGSPP